MSSRLSLRLRRSRIFGRALFLELRIEQLFARLNRAQGGRLKSSDGGVV
jgi:hypothetical protein